MESKWAPFCLLKWQTRVIAYHFHEYKTVYRYWRMLNFLREGRGSELQGVFIIPAYLSQGLEFDAVLVCDADNWNYHPSLPLVNKN